MNRIYLGCVLLLALTACQDTSTAPEPVAAGASEVTHDLTVAGGLGPKLPRPLYITTKELPQGEAGVSYLAALTARGGRQPHSWRLISGALPVGLTLSREGVLSGTPMAGVKSVLIVEVTDGSQRARKALRLVIQPGPVLTTVVLPPATEGMTWLAAPGTPVRLSASGGTPPLTFSAGPLPAGLAFDAGTGIFSGAPAQGSAGRYTVTVSVSDAAGRVRERLLPLDTVVPRPMTGGGTASVPPRGSPLTDTLTVFTVDSAGRGLPGVGVRVRRNGQEYDPPRQALTDAGGKVVFTGLGLDGESDTVDVTANGRYLRNVTMAKVNAALVTLAMADYSMPMPRYGFISAADPDSGRVFITGGYNALGRWGCIDNVLELDDASTNSWSEPVPHGLPSTLPAQAFGAGAFARGTLVAFGGVGCGDLEFLAATWEYAPDTRTWTRWDVEGPGARTGHVMTPDGTGERVVLFGGFPADAWGPANDTWVYAQATHTWEQRFPSGSTPEPRSGAGAAFDSLRGEMVVCGGIGAFGGDVSTCYGYSLASNAWRPLPSLPQPRNDFGMAFHQGTGELYVFGGLGNGVERNDLLVLRNGAWVTLVPDGAPGAPPRLFGHALVAEARSGQLVVVAGARDGVIVDGVWTFAPSTGQWTWRNPPRPRPTVRLSGVLSGGPPGFNILATVTVVGDAGYWNNTTVLLDEGTGRYELGDVPAGETLSVSAYVVNGEPSPDVLWSHADPGVVGPFTADTTLDIGFPPGPLPLVTTAATLTVPESWTSVTGLSGLPARQRPGFIEEDNGLGFANLAARSLRFETIPLSPGTTQRFTVQLRGRTPSACVRSWVYWEGPPAGPLSVPATSTGLAPGVAECMGAEPPMVVEEHWSLTPPQGSRLLRVGVRATDGLDDWLYYAPASDLPLEFRLPEPSTLAPSRPRPPGQRVSWYADTGVFTVSPFDYNDFSITWMQPDGWTRVDPFMYVRSQGGVLK